MCPWSDVVPEDVEARESPRAHYAKAFVHCLSFLRHCAFQLHTGPGFLRAHDIHLPPSGLLFFLRRPPFFSFFLSSPYPATFRGPVKRFFFLPFRFCALRERTNWQTIFFPVVS